MRTETDMIKDQIASIRQNSYRMTEREILRELDQLHRQREALQLATSDKFSLQEKKQLGKYYTAQIHTLRQSATLFIANMAQQARAIKCNVQYTEVVPS